MADSESVSLPSCANRSNYKWDQLDDLSQNLRCSRCQTCYYCSKECQKEHWQKVHKFHCKFLSGRKIQMGSQHDSKTCLYCVIEVKIGDKNMCSEAFSYLGCPWLKDDILSFELLHGVVAPSPLKLGEMSGCFQSKIEHSLFTLKRLIYKMSKIRHIVWREFQDEVKRIDQILDIMREEEIRASYLVFDPRFIQTENTEVFISSSLLKELNSLIKSIERKRRNDNLVDSGRLKLWDTFLVLQHFLYSHSLFDDIDVPNVYSHGVYHEITQDSIFNMWENILQELDSEDWTYSTIMSEMCPDNLVFSLCFSCSQTVDIPRHVKFHQPFVEQMSLIEDYYSHFREEPFMMVCQPFPIVAFVCASKECSTEFFDVCMSMECLREVKFTEASSMYRCDYCFKYGFDLHRCSGCLTKFYCGTECIDKDWKIHKEFCLKNERKTKDNSGNRMSKFANKLSHFHAEDNAFSGVKEEVFELIMEALILKPDSYEDVYDVFRDRPDLEPKILNILSKADIMIEEL